MRRPATLDDAAAMIARMGVQPDLPHDNRVALGLLLSLTHTAGPVLTDRQFSQLLTIGGILSRTVAIESLVEEIRAGGGEEASMH